MVNRLAWLVLLALLICGCTPTNSIRLPSWVQTPPNDNEQWLYGVGSAETLEAAKTIALADIAGKINTLVSNETQVYQQSNAHQSTEQLRANTITRTNATTLSHVQLQHSMSQNNTIWVLMALSKPDYAHSQRALLDDADKQLQQMMARFSAYTDLQRFVIYEELLNLLEQSRDKMVLLRATTGFNSTPYDIRHTAYRQAIEQSRDRLLISIDSDAGGQALAPQLLVLLTAIGVNAADNEEGNAQLKIDTTIESTVDHNDATKIRLTAVLTTRDTAGNVVGGSQHTAIGRSYSGYQHALQMASNNLALRLKQQGIIKGLGLEQR